MTKLPRTLYEGFSFRQFKHESNIRHGTEDIFTLPKVKTNKLKSTVTYTAPWNALTEHIISENNNITEGTYFNKTTLCVQ